MEQRRVVPEVTRTGGRLHDPAARPRVAIGAIFTECNHLGGAPVDRSWYERYELLQGDELLAGATGAVAGMLQVLRERHLTPVPLLYASTCAGGPLTRDTYEELKGEILARLRAALPVDGVLLPLHGAAAAEHVGDPEGDLIAAGARAGGRGHAGGGHSRPARPRHRRDGGRSRCPAGMGDLSAC